MNNLTPELIAKAKAAKSAEELLALAKENNVELTEEEAKTYFEQLNANGTVADDELGAVAGGSDLFSNKARKIVSGAPFRFISGLKCPECQYPHFKHINVSQVECLHCHTLVSAQTGSDYVELV